MTGNIRAISNGISILPQGISESGMILSRLWTRMMIMMMVLMFCFHPPPVQSLAADMNADTSAYRSCGIHNTLDSGSKWRLLEVGSGVPASATHFTISVAGVNRLVSGDLDIAFAKIRIRINGEDWPVSHRAGGNSYWHGQSGIVWVPWERNTSLRSSSFRPLAALRIVSEYSDEDNWGIGYLTRHSDSIYIPLPRNAETISLAAWSRAVSENSFFGLQLTFDSREAAESRFTRRGATGDESILGYGCGRAAP